MCCVPLADWPVSLFYSYQQLSWARNMFKENRLGRKITTDPHHVQLERQPGAIIVICCRSEQFSCFCKCTCACLFVTKWLFLIGLVGDVLFWRGWSKRKELKVMGSQKNTCTHCHLDMGGTDACPVCIHPSPWALPPPRPCPCPPLGWQPRSSLHTKTPSSGEVQIRGFVLSITFHLIHLACYLKCQLWNECSYSIDCCYVVPLPHFILLQMTQQIWPETLHANTLVCFSILSVFLH